MAINNVSDTSDTPKRITRTKILPGGARVRAAKPGETIEQIRVSQDRALKRTGHPVIVLLNQAAVDTFCTDVKAYFARESFRDKLERQYYAGELVDKPKPKVAKSFVPAAQ